MFTQGRRAGLLWQAIALGRRGRPASWAELGAGLSSCLWLVQLFTHHFQNMERNGVRSPWKKGLILSTKHLQIGHVSNVKVHTFECISEEFLGFRPVPGSVVRKPGGSNLCSQVQQRGYSKSWRCLVPLLCMDQLQFPVVLGCTQGCSQSAASRMLPFIPHLFICSVLPYMVGLKTKKEESPCFRDHVVFPSSLWFEQWRSSLHDFSRRQVDFFPFFKCFLFAL